MTAEMAPVFWMTAKAPPTDERMAMMGRGFDEALGRAR